jgi:hypothetical protein
MAGPNSGYNIRVVRGSRWSGLRKAGLVGADGSGQREGGVHLGYGGPDGGAVLPVSLAEVFACLRREFFGAVEVLRSCHGFSMCLRVPALKYYRAGKWICGSPTSG